MSVSTGLLLICWLLSGSYKDKLDIAKKNPAVLVSALLLCLYGIGTFYSSADMEHANDIFLKYNKLLLIPIVVTALTSEKIRVYAINAFLICSIIVLIISYLKLLGLYPHNDIGQGYIVFKNRIAGSIIMSFAMYWMLLRAKFTKGAHRIVWIALSLLAVGNVVFLVNGRTGVITLLTLAILFCYDLCGKSSLKYIVAILLVGSLTIYIAPNVYSSRLTTIKNEIYADAGHAASTSAGLRLEFYRNTIKMISHHPIFGGGTGSFKNEYTALANSQGLITKDVTNPHNQFLLTTQDLGMLGLVTLIAFWLIPWRLSYRLNPPEHGKALRGLVITIAIGSLFNSLLLDASEGKFYCLMAGILLSGYAPKESQTK
jgi:O-antigen ligase